MKKIVRLELIGMIVLITAAFIGYNIYEIYTAKEILTKDYIPNKPMVKIFDGGFENEGTTEIIDKVGKISYQKKVIDSATKSVSVYKLQRRTYNLVYRETEIEKFKDSYLKLPENISLTVLKDPIKKEVSWINKDDSIYKIVGVNEKIEILGKKIKTIKLKYIKNNYEYFIYFAKNLGIVRIDTEMGQSKLIKLDYDVDKYLIEKKMTL